LLHAEPNDHIVLLDGEHREHLVVDGRSRIAPKVTIEAAEGVAVVWSPPQAKVPQEKTLLLRVADVQDLRIKGIKLNGEGRLETLVLLTGTCPGLSLEDLTLEGFTRSGVAVTNCAGEEGRPVQLLRVVASATTKDLPEAALTFNAI